MSANRSNLRCTRAQIIFLFYLDDGKDRSSTMATKLGLSRQAVSLTALELERSGVIEFVTDKSKKSAKLIKMTKEGRRSMKYAFRSLSALGSKITDKIGKRKFADIKKTLQTDWDA